MRSTLRPAFERPRRQKPARPPWSASQAMPQGHIVREASRTVTAEDRLQNAERLLERLEEARSRLERTNDPDQAIEILAELSEIAKEVEAQLQAAKREVG